MSIDHTYIMPDCNLEAEQSVLGALMLDNQALDKIADDLLPEDFYAENHKTIYQAILNLHVAGFPIDLLTLCESVKAAGKLEAAGGVTYLSSLVNSVPTTANIVFHAKLIVEAARKRTIKGIAEAIYLNEGDSEGLLKLAESIGTTVRQDSNGGFDNIQSLVQANFEQAEYFANNKSAINGVPSGFSVLDNVTHGFQAGDLIVIGARPSMGKTALALNMAMSASQEGHTVAIFSFEMPSKQLSMRLLCTDAEVSGDTVKNGRLAQSDWLKMVKAAQNIADASIHISDTTNVSLAGMKAKCKKLKKKQGLSLVIVDYLQLMSNKDKNQSREQEISSISRGLKLMALELDIPVIVLSQLNRGVELRKPPVPMMSDLRESGAIEQDTDIILFLYRPIVYDKSARETDAELYIAKHRNGASGMKIQLHFTNSITKFKDYSLEEGF